MVSCGSLKQSLTDIVPDAALGDACLLVIFILIIMVVGLVSIVTTLMALDWPLVTVMAVQCTVIPLIAEVTCISTELLSSH